MKKRDYGLIMTLALMLSLCANAQAQRLPPDITVSNAQAYDVTIISTFVVPKDARNLTGLRVWHALPTTRPWDGLDRTLGASGITVEPDSGRLQYVAHNDSQNVNWELPDGLKPGTRLEFVSRFRVRSVDRNFDTKQSTAKWSDYQRNLDQVTLAIDAKLDSVVDEIKTSHSPAEAALEFCKWVTKHIKYDASVPYGARDLPSILQYQKGDCGHQMTVFEVMCLRAGIPTRTVVGLNLNTPGGVGDLHKIRPDFENQHTWAQIYLPGSGWVEIDPGQGARAYFLPAQLIQNNTDMQNYAIWVRENGTWKFADWEYRGGKSYSPYGIENRRTFRKVESK
jgi:transglutaminase-like putative cysteine protease